MDPRTRIYQRLTILWMTAVPAAFLAVLVAFHSIKP